MMEIIFLVGFRAVGKTTVGRQLAARLGYSFLDTDVLICEKKGATVNEIVKDEGWDGFRRCEQEVLLALGEQRRCVIATGGGAILHRHLWPLLKEHGHVVWLTADPEILCQRILADSTSADLRPSLSGKTVCAEVREILAVREPLYRDAADIIIDTGKLSVSEIVDKIITNYELRITNSSIHPAF
ncbi:MAG: shikimate kinase AroL [Desulfoarculaceae bacterium]|nr:shikimate kinase AroL [Desulfoarculaceae bacterium]